MCKTGRRIFVHSELCVWNHAPKDATVKWDNFINPKVVVRTYYECRQMSSALCGNRIRNHYFYYQCTNGKPPLEINYRHDRYIWWFYSRRARQSSMICFIVLWCSTTTATMYYNNTQHGTEILSSVNHTQCVVESLPPAI